MNQQGIMGNNRYQHIPPQNQQLYMNQQQRLMQQQRQMQSNQESLPQHAQFNSVSSSTNSNQQQMLMAQKMQMMMQNNMSGNSSSNNNNSNNYLNTNNALLQNQMMLNQQQQQQFNTMKPQQRQPFIQSQPQLQITKPSRLVLQMTNEERNVFSKLFQLVDRENKGRLSAQEGANFLKKSGLPKETLKQIYVIAAQTSTQFLDRDDFYIALRLVALAQNNLPFTKNSIAVNNPIPPLPVFNLQQNENDVVDVEQVFMMNEIDKEKYKRLFDKNKEFQDKISVGKSYQMWKSLNVPDTVIQRILGIVQPIQDKNFLNLKEFQVILHLIIQSASYEIPKVLPKCIASYLFGNYGQTQSQMQMQMQMQMKQQQQQMTTTPMQMQPQQQQPLNMQVRQQQTTQNQMQSQLTQTPQMHLQSQLSQTPQMQMQSQPSQMNPQIQMQQQQQQPKPIKKDIDLLLSNLDCGLPQQQQSQQPVTSIGPYIPQQQQQQQQNNIQNILPFQDSPNQHQPQIINQYQQQQQQPSQFQHSQPSKTEEDKAMSSLLIDQIVKGLSNYNNLTFQNDCLQSQIHTMKEKIKLCQEQLLKAALAITTQNDEIKKANNELTEVKNQLQLTILERERYEETYFKEKSQINQQLQAKQELIRKHQEEMKLRELENEQIQQKKQLEEEEIAKLRNIEMQNQNKAPEKQQVDIEQMNYDDFLNFPSTNDVPIAKESDFPSVNDNNNNNNNNQMGLDMNNNNENNEIPQHQLSQDMKFHFGNIDNDFQIETNQQQQQQQHQIEEPDFGFHIDLPKTNEKVINPYEEEETVNFNNDKKQQISPNQFNANISPITSTNFNPTTEMNFNQIENNIDLQPTSQHTVFPSFNSVMRESKEMNQMPSSNTPNFQFDYFNTGNTVFQDIQNKKSNDNFQLNINNNNNNFDDFDF